ncbi:CocE/NonD family hydrolase [Aurantimonas sp. VKM B-3413]|uniref:CocE/NonD family hydrolase n=1 Tax=Aurantimonas sp. VKM B-3413 TaxID=2779401 RepID=UPI001E34EBBD|nr:CocE/NonD family hydrolase [Aurantimonas sp. VKM B-3413]MCB8840394.1 CocE/NonD family hydrolase [Aurantimonas sp. VKM B-3413]
MKTVTEFPFAVREVEHFEIVMPDGCRLAARMWLPDNADAEPVPAILEYIPYRKNDGTLARDMVSARYVAGHGYAYVRLDLRGTGDSEGVMLDEYTQQELDDGCDAIAWIASQPWCDGNIGMIGISWGGFNGLQIAAMQPPALKAVITCCSTDDRYADDIHYMGGTFLIDQISWASVMFAGNTLPPDPRNVGERWRKDWLRRLDESGLWLETWLRHQRRDAFWQHGSICEDYAAVKVPVYAVSGWADGYCRSVFRLLENLSGPTKGLIGPWAHKYPNLGVPGPAIGFLQEELRWWDQWLKRRETGIMDEPPLRLFMQDHAAPAGSYRERAGRWIAEPSWPSPNVARTPFRLTQDGRLRLEADEARNSEAANAHEGGLDVSSPLRVGLGGGKWCSYAVPGDQPVDQREDDSGSLVFETAPLGDALEIAGDAALDLSFRSDRPVAIVAVRLSDVAPDGSATRVSYGLFNLTHRNGHDAPESLEPGRSYLVRIPFKPVAQSFRPGHRLRLSISTTYFPLAWPAPEPVRLTVDPAKSSLDLPVRDCGAQDFGLPDFGEPEGAEPLAVEWIAEPTSSWRVIEDLAEGATRVEIVEDDGTARIIGNDLTVTQRAEETYGFSGNDYRSVMGETLRTCAMQRGDWSVRSRTWMKVTSTEEHFVIEAKLEAWEGEEPVRTQEWSTRVERDLV